MLNAMLAVTLVRPAARSGTTVTGFTVTLLLSLASTTTSAKSANALRKKLPVVDGTVIVTGTAEVPPPARPVSERLPTSVSPVVSVPLLLEKNTPTPNGPAAPGAVALFFTVLVTLALRPAMSVAGGVNTDMTRSGRTTLNVLLRRVSFATSASLREGEAGRGGLEGGPGEGGWR